MTDLFIFYIVILFVFAYVNNNSNIYLLLKNSNQFIKNNISVCLFIPSIKDDFPFLQGIIDSVDTFWPKGIGKKIHWIDSYKGNITFNYSDDWTIIKSSTPKINTKVMRQQYNSFISYKYCLPNEFVAMIDSDSVFISYVTYSMLFDDSRRPFMLYSLKYRTPKWNPTKILKTKNSNWGDVMISYPIIFKATHIMEIYKYIETIHNSSLIKLMNIFTFGQFGTFFEYIRIMKYENQYALINVENNPFPPRCVLHIPYCVINVNWGNIRYVYLKRHNNKTLMNNVISYLITQGICAYNKLKCKHFDEKEFNKNSYTLEKIVKKHFYLK